MIFVKKKGQSRRSYPLPVWQSQSFFCEMSELKEVPSDTNEMDIGEGQQNKDNGEQLPIQEGQEDGSQTNQSQQKAQRTPAFANQLPPSVSQQRVKPKRSTNALHLLFLESSKAVNSTFIPLAVIVDPRTNALTISCNSTSCTICV